MVASLIGYAKNSVSYISNLLQQNRRSDQQTSAVTDYVFGRMFLDLVKRL